MLGDDDACDSASMSPRKVNDAAEWEVGCSFASSGRSATTSGYVMRHSAVDGNTTCLSALQYLLHAAKLARSAIRGGRCALPRSTLVAVDGAGLSSGSGDSNGEEERTLSEGVAGGVDGSTKGLR